MNYIKRLRQENETLRAEYKKSIEGLDSLIRYCGSGKFSGFDNNYVNPQDIITRVYEIKSSITYPNDI